MPIIKSAKKKMRQDVKRQKSNQIYINKYKQLVKSLKTTKDKSKLIELLKKAYSAVDRAVTKKVIHANRGKRIKSRIAKFAAKK